jgi:hypothetical protein
MDRDERYAQFCALVMRMADWSRGRGGHDRWQRYYRIAIANGMSTEDWLIKQTRAYRKPISGLDIPDTLIADIRDLRMSLSIIVLAYPEFTLERPGGAYSLEKRRRWIAEALNLTKDG